MIKISRNLIIIAVVAIVLIGGVVLFAGSQSSNPSPTPTPTKTVQEILPTESIEKEAEDGEAAEGAEMSKTSIEIKNFAFGPKTLTVKKGTRVTFTNQDSVGHTATSDDGNFGTEILAKGESESVTFDKAGAYTYHCTPHPYMKATIIVE